MENIKKNKISSKRKKDLIFIYVLMLWPILHFLVFWLGMNVRTIFDSFFKINYTDGVRYDFVAFDNYIDAFRIIFGKVDVDGNSVLNYRGVLNSLSLIPLSLFINMPITILFAYAIYKKVFAYRFFRTILFLPAIISTVVLCLCFKLAIDPTNGIVIKFLKLLGLAGDGTFGNQGIVPNGGWLGVNEYKWKTILIFSVLTGVSGNLIYFTSTMSRFPESVFESAEIDGASVITQFIKIVVPFIWPTMTTMTITLIASSFSWMMPSLLLTGRDGMTTTIGLMITETVKNDKSNTVMSAMGVIVAVFGGILIFSVYSLMNKVFEGVEY